MKILQRSISYYQKPQRSNVALPKRQVSVPSTNHQQKFNEDEVFPPSPISKDALECIKDAAGCFSSVVTMLLQSPLLVKVAQSNADSTIPSEELIDPDYTPENFHPALTDAEYLLPVICSLVTDHQPDNLSLVREIITRMHAEKPNLEPQSMTRALHALKNAIVLLHLDDSDGVNVNTLLTEPREFLAAAMIVNEYLKNLVSYHTQLY